MVSLEELLADDGFRGRRSLASTRPSLSTSLYPFRDQNRIASPSNRIKTEKVRSDVSRHALMGRLPRSDSHSGRKTRDSLVRRETVDKRSMKEHKQRLAEDFQGSEIVEEAVEESVRVMNIHYDEVKRRSEQREKYLKGIVEKERPKESSGKDVKVDKTHGNNSNRGLLRSDRSRRSLKEPETNYDRSNRGSFRRKKFEDDNEKPENAMPPASEPALDEVAVQAIVSILSGYIKQFLKDVDFRTTLHHNTFSSLNFIELGEEYSNEIKVIANLEQAIETVERAAEESASSKELKRASLQLSVITGLNSSDKKDGFTYGIPNSKLSACAYLYLSVIYKLQKKERISAKHLLQVFCDSPFIARTTLLPELWDHVFSPHLAHLKVWYKQEAECLTDAPNRPRKLELLEKVYNEILDSGTYQFAAYYKDWLTEGVEAPSIPSIQIPSRSVHGLQRGGSFDHYSEVASPAGPFSPQPMVSKKLHDAVFGRSSKPKVEGAENDGEIDTFDNGVRSSDGSIVEVKQTLTCSSEIVKCTYQDVKEGSTKSVQDALYSEEILFLTHEEGLRLQEVSASPERDVSDKVSILNTSKKTEEEPLGLCAPSNIDANELAFKRLARSVFEQQQPESTSAEQPIRLSLFLKGLQASPEYFDEGSLFTSIPQDFICPLTRRLFEDPVTLETGQSFEREAIKKWIEQGNKTCPVTGKALESTTIPLTNFILKRVIGAWKLENCRHLLAFASQIVGKPGEESSTNQNETPTFILEQLLTSFSSKDRITNTKHFISLGGLQFLIQRFELGNLEEKTHVAALLSCCIEADTSCRSQITRSINKESLLELLHSKQVKSRTNAVLLLTELVCLNRRRDVASLLRGLQNEQIVKAMHVLLVFLQSSPPEQKPLLSVLLLHLDLLVEPRKYSIYREAAVDAISLALDESLTSENVREKCCRALLILGGRLSCSGELVTESWILKQAGFNEYCCEVNSLNNEENDLVINDSIDLDNEEDAIEKWLRKLSASLLGNGKKSFLETISKSLGSGNLNLIRVCLVTVAWLSSALSSQSDTKFQLSAFSALIAQLKEILEHGEQLQLKVLASLSLLNFSRISECRVLLMTIAEEIIIPLRSLAEETWTAKQLYAIISREGR
ncbi:putative E3 ubiquitin-protein ligase LIN-1 isoform X2 [Mangifera indica]|uniref:putative E3 ubiquitin-protein ligase LIN-1 isoform X2 n=1 Tax=Mangifera indica TaxID=29780 RepID=UPI001CFAB4A9|nr:putative E3 ubiquitin-protein ligase LIN-1 isoform X2 [Mangifera indica]